MVAQSKKARGPKSKSKSTKDAEQTRSEINSRNIKLIRKFCSNAKGARDLDQSRIKQERKRNEALFKATKLIEEYRSKIQKKTSEAKKSRLNRNELGNSEVKRNCKRSKYGRQNQFKKIKTRIIPIGAKRKIAKKEPETRTKNRHPKEDFIQTLLQCRGRLQPEPSKFKD